MRTQQKVPRCGFNNGISRAQKQKTHVVRSGKSEFVFNLSGFSLDAVQHVGPSLAWLVLTIVEQAAKPRQSSCKAAALLQRICVAHSFDVLYGDKKPVLIAATSTKEGPNGTNTHERDHSRCQRTDCPSRVPKRAFRCAVPKRATFKQLTLDAFWAARSERSAFPQKNC